MQRLLVAILIGLLPLSAYAFNGFGSNVVKLQSADYNGLDIQASPHSAGTFTYVMIENNSQQKASCQATFRNGPELPKLGKSQAEVEPSSTGYLTYIPKRPGLVTRINLKCNPA